MLARRPGNDRGVRVHNRLLTFLRCPACRATLTVATGEGEEEVAEGLLTCDRDHWFPIVRGIPRMLPDAIDDHWSVVETLLASLPEERASSVRRLRTPA